MRSEAAGAARLLLEPVAGAVGGGRFFEDAGEFAGEVSLVGEAAVVADFGEGMSGADNEVASFLDAEVAEVFLGGHVEAGFEFPQEAAEGEVGIFGEFGDGDVVTVALVEECQSGSEFLVLGSYTMCLFSQFVTESVPFLANYYIILAIPLSFGIAFGVGYLGEWVLISRLYKRPLDPLPATWGLSLLMQQIFKTVVGAS